MNSHTLLKARSDFPRKPLCYCHVKVCSVCVLVTYGHVMGLLKWAFWEGYMPQRTQGAALYLGEPMGLTDYIPH